MRLLTRRLPTLKSSPLRLTRSLFGFIATLSLITACLPGTPVIIKIGLVAPFSGRYHEIGYQAIRGARLALSEYNAARGRDAPLVELLALNDSGEVTAAIEQANKLLTDEAVIAVIGHWLDDTTSAAAPIYSRAALPILATSAAPSKPVAGGHSFFRMYPTADMLATEMTQIAHHYEADSTCDCAIIAGSNFLAAIRAKIPGATVVGGPLWSLREFISLAGENAHDSYFITPVPHPLVSQEASEFLAHYRSSFPDEQIGWVSVHAYEATQVLLAALSESPEPTAPNIQAALSRSDYSSRILGDIRFTEHGEWKTPQFHLYRWVGVERTLP